MMMAMVGLGVFLVYSVLVFWLGFKYRKDVGGIPKKYAFLML